MGVGREWTTAGSGYRARPRDPSTPQTPLPGKPRPTGFSKEVGRHPPAPSSH